MNFLLYTQEWPSSSILPWEPSVHFFFLYESKRTPKDDNTYQPCAEFPWIGTMWLVCCCQDKRKHKKHNKMWFRHRIHQFDRSWTLQWKMSRNKYGYQGRIEHNICCHYFNIINDFYGSLKERYWTDIMAKYLWLS